MKIELLRREEEILKFKNLKAVQPHPADDNQELTEKN